MADKKTDKPKTATAKKPRRGLPPELVAFNRCVVALQKLTDEQQQKARALLDAYLGPRQGFLVGELMTAERMTPIVGTDLNGTKTISSRSVAELVDPASCDPGIDDSKEPTS